MADFLDVSKATELTISCSLCAGPMAARVGRSDSMEHGYLLDSTCLSCGQPEQIHLSDREWELCRRGRNKTEMARIIVHHREHDKLELADALG